jgi:hypothetical protein
MMRSFCSSWGQLQSAGSEPYTAWHPQGTDRPSHKRAERKSSSRYTLYHCGQSLHREASFVSSDQVDTPVLGPSVSICATCCILASHPMLAMLGVEVVEVTLRRIVPVHGQPEIGGGIFLDIG